jgi:hypothetical protein
MPHGIGDLTVFQLIVIENPISKIVSITCLLNEPRTRQYHLLIKTSNTVLTMFNKMHAKSITVAMVPLGLFAPSCAIPDSGSINGAMLLISTSFSRSLGIVDIG